MKCLFVFILAIAPCASFATAPSTSCPSGYTSAGAAASCLIDSPTVSCIMYAPATTEYDDVAGVYLFTAACPLE